MQPHIPIVPNPPPEAMVIPEVSDGELTLLRDVHEHPYAGVVERYKRLALSRRKGNERKEACMAKELVSPVDIPTRSGKLVLLDLTPTGRALLRQHGVELPDRSRHGGLEHEYWKHTIATALKQRGHTTQMEQGAEHRTDIIATKDGATWAIEIETGKSDWKGNLQKNREGGHRNILILATNEDAYTRIVAHLAAESPEHDTIRLIHAWDFLDRAQRNRKDIRTETEN